ncbi:MAG: hypothetical protein JXL80_10035 [Planctomycetes bacterium]|nr:hypothetical protein [Planctomycetota bacterium]
MEFLQQKLEQLKATWLGLSNSGRLALVMVVLLVVAVLAIVAQNTGSPDLSPLPVQFAADELDPAVDVLRGKEIRYEVRGNQIFVPSEIRPMALGMLATSEAISSDSDIDVEQLFSGGSMWTPNEERDRQWKYFRKRELEKWIRGLPGVRRACVNINYGTPGTIGRVPHGVSASVAVDTSHTQPLAYVTAATIAHWVTRATNGLTVDKVAVIDRTHGRHFDIDSGGASASSAVLRAQKEYEKHYEETLRNGLAPFIPGVVVGVTATVSAHAEKMVKHEPDKDKMITGSMKERNREVTGATGGGEPGVVSNTSAGVGAAASNSSFEKSSEENMGNPLDWGKTDVVTDKFPGTLEQVKATVSVPRSYFVNILHMRGEVTDDKVDEAKLTAVMTTELEKIRKQAETLVGTAAGSIVSVDWFYDMAGETDEAEAGSGDSGIMMAAMRYGPSVALGVLAVLALLMVYKVVSKLQPAQMPAEGRVAEESVGEAGLTLDSILEGVELEAETIRTSKMQDQISDMIREDPESVANLMKRWISKE